LALYLLVVTKPEAQGGGARVIAACGTPPATLPVGSLQIVFQNIHGQVCQ